MFVRECASGVDVLTHCATPGAFCLVPGGHTMSCAITGATDRTLASVTPTRLRQTTRDVNDNAPVLGRVQFLVAASVPTATGQNGGDEIRTREPARRAACTRSSGLLRPAVFHHAGVPTRASMVTIAGDIAGVAHAGRATGARTRLVRCFRRTGMAAGCFGELLLAEGRDGAPLENESRFAGRSLDHFIFVPLGLHLCPSRTSALRPPSPCDGGL